MKNSSDSYTESIAQFEGRKKDHIDLSLDSKTQTVALSGFEQIDLVHDSLPELDFDATHLNTPSLGFENQKALYVAAMTAGHKEAEGINYRLAEACEQSGWTMMVGSQRRELFDSSEKNAWKDIVSRFPSVKLIGNLGLSQIVGLSMSQIENLVTSTKCVGLAIHCNPLQEVLQPEGTPYFSGAIEKLKEISERLSVPVILKETGSGFSMASLEKVKSLNFGAIDVSGLGGTHWGRIEGYRTKEDSRAYKAAQVFGNWGVSTPRSVKNAVDLRTAEVWGSGGVRNGLEAAKLFALGATRVGMAKPLLEAALVSSEAVKNYMDDIEFQIRVALFCTGSKNISAIKGKYLWKQI